MVEFISIETVNEDERRVSLAVRDDGVYLLGGLAHGTKIIVTQGLVDALQEVLNDENKA